MLPGAGDWHRTCPRFSLSLVSLAPMSSQCARRSPSCRSFATSVFWASLLFCPRISGTFTPGAAVGVGGLVGGAAVAVAVSASVAVGGIDVEVGGTAVAVGGIGVAVGGTAVA